MQSVKKIEDYLLEEPIGEGQFGKVYRACHVKTKKHFAVKVISKKLFKNNKLLKNQLKRETVIMSGKQHTNLMHMHRSFETSRNYYLVLDLCEGGDLNHFMRKNKIKNFGEAEAIFIMKQVIKGFVELQKRNVIHRDLKLENIFIKGTTIVLGDFGVAKVVKEMTSTTVGTPLNMAPEVMARNDYDSKSDLWSLGILLFELLFGKAPFFALSIGELKHMAQTKSGKNLNLKKYSHICDEIKDLLKQLLEPNPVKRISWKNLFNHKIFSKNHLNSCCHYKKSNKSFFLKKFEKKQKSSSSSKNFNIF